MIYTCPVCQRNKSKFYMIMKLAQEVTHDPNTGKLLYVADELETLTLADGRPDLEMRCATCGHTGPEDSFLAAKSLH